MAEKFRDQKCVVCGSLIVGGWDAFIQSPDGPICDKHGRISQDAVSKDANA